MIAAIYARKSTEQRGVAEEVKSVNRQIANARAFAALRGWTVAADHIFVDDGISGAEFERRPGFMRLLDALAPRPPFQVLIVSERKTIGRESYETGYRIKQIDEAGVELVEYVHGRSLTPKTWIEKVTSDAEGWSDELQRQKTSERTHEAHTAPARVGRVPGGRVFGYRNKDVFKDVDQHGRPLRSHVEREIVPEEAAVIRRIFELYDYGLGLKAIAKRLNAEGAPSPKPFTRKDGLAPIGQWVPSTIRAALARELYHGVAVWNKTKKKTKWGKMKPTARPESEWERAPVEHLRIVDEAHWRRVQARRQETAGRALRFASGRITGRPPKHATKNLLAGLATCARCGGGLVVEQSNNKKGRYAYYVCLRRWHHGTCTNRLRVPIADVNEAVLQAIEEHALTPAAVEAVVQLTERDDVQDQQMQLVRERKGNDKRLKNLGDAIETGGEAATLMARVHELEARQRAIADELASLAPLPRLAPRVVNDRLEEWRRLLRGSTTQARAVLQRVLKGRITFTPNDAGYTFEAPTRFDKLFAGVACPWPGGSPQDLIDHAGEGCEHIRLEDTLDFEYGRLLARVYQGVLRPAGFEPATLGLEGRGS